MEVRAIQLATADQIYSDRRGIAFPDRTDIVSVFLSIQNITFPAPGFYLFQLLVDDELIEGAQRRLQVRRGGLP